MAYLNQRARTASETQAALGAEIACDGSKYRCVHHNDLGVLYWQVIGRNGNPKGKMLYSSYFDSLAGFPGAY
jgi:hypothetical protein